ncbi:MAG: ABC transporter substrate-binding protein [Myxococcota bacterium]
MRWSRGLRRRTDVGPRPALAAAAALAVVMLSASDLSFYEEALPTTLNPLFARSMVDRRAQELVFDRLFYRSAITSEIKSRLVQTTEVLDGGRGVKLTLKEGIRWHDGEPLTPADICFTLDAMRDPRTPTQVGKVFEESVASCEASRRDVTIRFTKAYHNPTERLEFSVLPKHAFRGETAIQPDDDFSSRPIGTGPMKGSRGKREVRFTAYPNAHHAPRIDVLQLGEGGDPLIQVRTLMNLGVHGIVNVPPPYRGDVAASDDIALKSYDLRSWWFAAMNTRRGPLQDKRIRQAVDAALDREELRRLTMGYDPDDIQQPCQFISGPFVPASSYYNRSVKVRTRSDLARVRQLMLSAGAKDSGGTWTLGGAQLVLNIGMEAPLDLEARDLLNQIGNQLQSAGFGRQVHKVSADDWVNQVITGKATDFDMLIGKWSFGVVEDVTPMFHTRTGGLGAYNIFNYSNPTADAMLARYDDAKTDTEAQDAFHELHELLADELPYLFLWKLDTKSGWRMEVKGNTITPYFYFTEFDGWTVGS